MAVDALPRHERSFRAMASPCRLQMQAERPAAHIARALDAAQAEVLRIEAKFSRYRSDSVLSQINAAAGRPEPVAIDEETAALLAFAEQVRRESAGLFDIRSGVLGRAWDFRSGRLPAAAEIQALLPRVHGAEIELDERQVRLPVAGMALDLGGVGKEYAADRAATLLIDAGACGGLVDLGGDLRVLGPGRPATGWRLGVAHPRRSGQVVSEVHLRHGALATSGDYERYMEVDGQRYCHILNPHTGLPARHWQSVSVIAPSCLAAGALTTVAMLMEQAAPEFLKAQGVAALLIDQQGQLLMLDWPAEPMASADA